MKEKLKNKKSLIFIGVALVVFIGITLAFFSTTDYFENIFQTGSYESESEEVFTPPEHWHPGDTTPKTIVVNNTGDKCQNVRISYTEEWEGSDGSTVPNTQNGTRAAIINLDNRDDWVYRDGYYYYNKNLQPNQSTNSFMSSVTFNPDIENIYTCTQTATANGAKRSCEGDASYDDADYTLTLKVETIYCDSTEDAWGVDPTELVNKKAKLSSFDLMTNDLIWTPNYSEEDVGAIKRSDTNLSTCNASNNCVQYGSQTSTEEPLYMWLEEPQGTSLGTIWYYSLADTIVLEYNYTITPTGLSGYTNLSDISGLADFDVSNISDFQNFFADCESLTSLQSIANWDVSNVVNFYGMFDACSSLRSLSALSRWDTSSATQMSNMFGYCYNLVTLQGLENWDTSNVENMAQMFTNCTSLVDVSAINDWDLGSLSGLTVDTNSNKTYRMFYTCPVHPTFTYMAGTWDSNGTFIASS